MDDSDQQSKEQNTSQYSSGETNERPLRSLTRLVLGGVLVGRDELVSRIDEWERTSETEPAQSEPLRDQVDQSDDIEPLPEELPPPPAGLQQVPGRDLEIDDVAVGLLFTLQDRIEARMDQLSRLGSRFVQISSPVAGIDPPERVRKTVDRWVTRGQQEVNNWSARGKQEKQRSKKVFSVASHSMVDDSIDYLTHNPELEELVQQQGTGLAEEVMEEMRERAFSMDILLESSVRSFFRMKPRSSIPPPSIEVRKHAEHIRRRKPQLHGH